MVEYNKMKEQLLFATMGCGIQHNGWTCGSCFFSIGDNLNNKHLQSILYFRGDYKVKDLDNLPIGENYEKYINEVYKLAGGK